MTKVTVFIVGGKVAESHDWYNGRIRELKKIINFTHVLQSSGKDIGSTKRKWQKFFGIFFFWNKKRRSCDSYFSVCRSNLFVLGIELTSIKTPNRTESHKIWYLDVFWWIYPYYPSKSYPSYLKSSLNLITFGLRMFKNALKGCIVIKSISFSSLYDLSRNKQQFLSLFSIQKKRTIHLSEIDSLYS